MRGFLEHVSTIHDYVIFVYIYTTGCKSILLALPLVKVPLKRDLP